MLIPCRRWQVTSERAELLIAVSEYENDFRLLAIVVLAET